MDDNLANGQNLIYAYLNIVAQSQILVISLYVWNSASTWSQIIKLADFKSTIMRKSAKAFNISGWLFFSLIEKSKVPIQTSYLPH